MEGEDFEDQPAAFDSTQKPFYQRKGLVVVLLVFMFLIISFLVFDGQTWVRRVFRGEVKRENLAPNPGFEKGSNDLPAGWTTESEIIVGE